MEKLIIGADLVPTDTNTDLFINGDAETLVGRELLDILKSVKYRIFNLEIPLTDIESPIQKQGPNLIAPTKTIAGYKALGVDLLTLANNHILDQGQQGLESTCKILKENKIDFLGVGATYKEATKPYIFDFVSKKIGVYACAEHEFSIVTNYAPGANPFDPLETLDHISSLKEKCDYLIVLYHGGKEHYRYPSPYLQKVCRKMVEKGADLVICQHSHCIGCEEKYLAGTIVYGQGNFLFDHSKNICWQTSLLISVDELFEVSYIPLVKNDNVVRLATGEKAVTILQEFKERSEQIKSHEFIENKYKEFADEMFIGQFLPFTGKESVLFRAINKLCSNKLRQYKIKKKYTQKNLLIIRNYIECEAHRELFLKGLEEK